MRFHARILPRPNRFQNLTRTLIHEDDHRDDLVLNHRMQLHVDCEHDTQLHHHPHDFPIEVLRHIPLPEDIVGENIIDLLLIQCRHFPENHQRNPQNPNERYRKNEECTDIHMIPYITFLLQVIEEVRYAAELST